MATPKQTDPQFKLRLTTDLKDKIEADASSNNRSMNAEIVARLEESFTWPSTLDGLRRERDYIESEWKKAAQIAKEIGSISHARMLLEADRQRLQAQEAATNEVKEQVEREMRHLMQVHEQNNAQMALLEKIGTDALEATAQRDSDLEIELAATREKAAKMEGLLFQARSRLGIVRSQRDELARFAKLINEGMEDDFMGAQKISELSERELLTRLFYKISQVSSELIVQRGRERTALRRLPTEEEWEEIRSAPLNKQADITNALASSDIDHALKIARGEKEGAA